MKLALAVVASTSFTVFSCQDRMAGEFTDSLVDRFDAPSCLDARVLSAGGREGESGRKAFRNFEANGDCAAEIVAGANEAGFEQDATSAYVYHDSFGMTEKIEIGQSEAADHVQIDWTEWGFEK